MHDVEELPAFVLAGFALAGSPGPATLSLAATGAAFGARRGVGYMTGILLGMVPVMAVTGTGLLGMLLALPGTASVVSALAAAYFAYLAFRIAAAPPLSAQADRSPVPSFAGGVFLSLVNPKAYAAVAALFSGFVLIRGQIELDAAAKFAVLVVITATVNAAWLLGGAALTRFFREPRTNRTINVMFATLLIASVALTLLL
jgi:threonine/homoserine/homoserine lactone efflux protein